MGVTHVGVTVRNPAAADADVNRGVLADTGVIDSLAPRRNREAIGWKPTGRRRYATADGREV